MRHWTNIFLVSENDLAESFLLANFQDIISYTEEKITQSFGLSNKDLIQLLQNLEDEIIEIRSINLPVKIGLYSQDSKKHVSEESEVLYVDNQALSNLDSTEENKLDVDASSQTESQDDNAGRNLSEEINRQERNNLFKRIAALPGPQLEQLIFALDIPKGHMPGDGAKPAKRVKAMLDWAESESGCGLDEVINALNDL